MKPFSPGLTAAALALCAAAPATAQTLAGAGFSGSAALSTEAGMGGSGVAVHRGDNGEFGSSGHGDRRGGYGSGYYSELRPGYDLNHVWASDSFNDWWHDRPERAFPRWMSSNQDCQRQWWSGGGWRC